MDLISDDYGFTFGLFVFNFIACAAHVIVWWLAVPAAQKRSPEEYDFWKGISIGAMTVIFFGVFMVLFNR